MITSMRGCAACNNHWPWPISSRSFSHVFAIKLLKYNTSCVCSTALTVLDEIFPYLAQMIISMRGCVACNDLWPWPISSRLFSCDILWIIFICGTNKTHEGTICHVPFPDQQVKGQGHTGHLLFLQSGSILVDHWSTISSFHPNWVFPDCNSSLNTLMATKWCTKLVVG